MNQNKFSTECEEFEKEIDRLTIQKDYGGLLAYLKVVEAFSESHCTPEYALFFIASERPTAYWLITSKEKEQSKTQISTESNLYTIREKLCLC